MMLCSGDEEALLDCEKIGLFTSGIKWIVVLSSAPFWDMRCCCTSRLKLFLISLVGLNSAKVEIVAWCCFLFFRVFPYLWEWLWEMYYSLIVVCGLFCDDKIVARSWIDRWMVKMMDPSGKVSFCNGSCIVESRRWYVFCLIELTYESTWCW